MNKVFETAKKTIIGFDLPKTNRIITVALSGGADSVCLLHLLCKLQSELDFTVKAVHINHNLRGDESLRDEQFVRDLCKKNDVELTVFSEDMKQGAKDNKQGIEEYSRNRRYAHFHEIAKSSGGFVATAHNANDVAETLIFNIARGCGLNGISSIKAKRDEIIRPLINVTREEIEQYLIENNIDYVTDSTNLTDDYTRNKIRHNIIPALMQINPSFLNSVKRLSDSAESAVEYISANAEILINSNASAGKIAEQPDAVICEYIVKRCKIELGISPEYSQIISAKEMIKQNSKSVKPIQLSGGNFICILDNEVCIGEKYDRNAPFLTEFSTGIVKTPHCSYKIDIISKKDFQKSANVNNLLLKNALDYDKIGKDLVLRSRLEHDKIKQKGRNCTKSLKKLFNEMKIPLKQRDKLLVLSSRSGDVLWVEQVGASEQFCITDETKKVILISKYEP